MSWPEVGRAITVYYDHLVLLYFLAANTHYLVLMLVGFRGTIDALRTAQWRDSRRLMRSPLTPPISVMVPAWNEEASIAASVRNLLTLQYPRLEIIVVNDGSRDRTLEVLVEAFGLRPVARSAAPVLPCAPIRGIYESAEHPNLVVVDKVNAGSKADALTAGLALCTSPPFCAVDADSLLEPDALLRVVRPFMDEPGLTVATGGVVRIVNGCDVRAGRMHGVRLPRKMLPLIQVVEYLRAFLFGRMGWSAVDGLLAISGAFGLFDRRAVIEAGGYAADTVGEDLELVLRLRRRLRERGVPHRVRFVPDPVCWTEAPESLRALRRQRNRWQRGLADSLWRHRQVLGRPRHGRTGLVAVPCLAAFELAGPLLELSGYVVVPVSFLLGIVDLPFMLAFLAAAVLYGVVLSVCAVLLEDLAFRRHPRGRDLARLVMAAIVENFGYRQLTAWWRGRALLDYWRGDLSWGRMERRGAGAAGAGGNAA
jgi:cellulose synthase/poly-beta-1,6-N-acetylglucosamine synthase-like glycosyltransferase